jgi:adenosine deaminase
MMAEFHLPITVRIIVCGMRQMHQSVSRELAEIAWRYKDRGVAGFDLAGTWSFIGIATENLHM